MNWNLVRSIYGKRRFFRNQPIKNKNGVCRPCLLMDRDEMRNIYRGPSIETFYQITVHLVKWFQRRRFFSSETAKSNELKFGRMHLWEVLYKEWSFSSDSLTNHGSFGKVISKEKIFRNRSIRNKNSLWRPCLLMNRDEMRNLYRGPSIDASYQI
jgi:hypothetical protein